jgi:hypothetical protein
MIWFWIMTATKFDDSNPHNVIEADSDDDSDVPVTPSPSTVVKPPKGEFKTPERYDKNKKYDSEETDVSPNSDDEEDEWGSIPQSRNYGRSYYGRYEDYQGLPFVPFQKHKPGNDVPLWKFQAESITDLPGAPGMFRRHDPFHTYFMEMIQWVFCLIGSSKQKSQRMPEFVRKALKWNAAEMVSYIVYLIRLSGYFKMEWQPEVMKSYSRFALAIVSRNTNGSRSCARDFIEFLKKVRIVPLGKDTIALEKGFDTLFQRADTLADSFYGNDNSKERASVFADRLFYETAWDVSIGICYFISEYKEKYLSKLGTLRMVQLSKTSRVEFTHINRGTPVKIYYEEEGISFFKEEDGENIFMPHHSRVVITYSDGFTIFIDYKDWVKIPSEFKEEYFLPHGMKDDKRLWYDEPEEGEVLDEASPEYKKKRKRIGDLLNKTFSDRGIGLEFINWKYMKELLDEIDVVITDSGLTKVCQDFDQWKKKAVVVFKYENKTTFDQWVLRGKSLISEILKDLACVKKQDSVDIISDALSGIHLGITGKELF